MGGLESLRGKKSFKAIESSGALILHDKRRKESYQAVSKKGGFRSDKRRNVSRL